MQSLLLYRLKMSQPSVLQSTCTSEYKILYVLFIARLGVGFGYASLKSHCPVTRVMELPVLLTQLYGELAMAGKAGSLY